MITLVGSPCLPQSPQAPHVLQRGGRAEFLDSASFDGPFQSVTFAKGTPPPWLTTEFCVRMTASFLFWFEDLGRLADLGPQPQSLIATFSTPVIVL